MDTIGVGVSFFNLKMEIMLQDPTFQDLLMSLLTFILGWFLKRPTEMFKKGE